MTEVELRRWAESQGYPFARSLPDGRIIHLRPKIYSTGVAVSTLYGIEREY